jgi:excisionase family DNA binding protein
MEHLMTVKDVAEYMRLSEQTIQRWVLKREIPFHKVRKVIRFRATEIEKWINEGGGKCPDRPADGREGDLFAAAEETEKAEAATEAGEGTAESRAGDGGGYRHDGHGQGD